MRKFFRQICFLFLIVVILCTTIVGNSFAIVDIPTEANYIVKGTNGDQEFETSMPSLRWWPYFDTRTDVEGDLSIELGNPFCLAYMAGFFAAIYANVATKPAAIGALALTAAEIYNVARQKFEDFEICGANWLVWGNQSKSATNNVKTYYPEFDAFKGSKKRTVIDCIKDRSQCDQITKNFMGARKFFNITDRVFRERLYDGEEVVNNNCKDPRTQRTTYDVSGTGQLYYMRGFTQGNYACDRFLKADAPEKTQQFKDAYDCCVKTSKSICITDKMSAPIETRSSRSFFCDIDNKLCTYDAFIFQIFRSEEGEKGVYCGRTWSLCPYNFNIEKGSEKSSYFDKTVRKRGDSIIVDDPCFDKTNNMALLCSGKRKNFYQYRRHCTIVEKWIQPDDYDDIDYAPFIDKACINFVGSSHNTVEYKSYNGYHKMFNQYKSFTAPIAECITETLKNFLYNRAGHTKCLTTGGFSDDFGNCTHGYEYQEGDNLLDVKGIVDPVSRLLGYIDGLIKLALTIMIVLYGYGILVNSVKLTKKDMILMLLKVVIVLTFASSFWWRTQLFRFVYGFSESFSALTSKLAFDDTLDIEFNLIKYDGCYFGDINNILGKRPGQETPNVENNNYYNYPSSRRYVAMFDSLDCKIHKYLGYSVGKSLPNVLYVIATSIIWPFNIGIFLAVASVMVALFVISFAIRVVYIFIAASIGLALMLYISPIIIPCILFPSRKKMFDSWLKQVLSYSLQPLFLFGFISISLVIMDSYVLGEGIFTGSGPQRELICGYVCKGTDDDTIVSYGDNVSDADCHEDETLIELKNKSVLCLLEKATATPFTVFNSIGIFLSFLTDLQLSDLIMFLRIAFLFFILNNVSKTIPSIASNITGTNTNLPGLSEKADPFALATKLKGMGGVAQRIFKYTGLSAVGTGKKIGLSAVGTGKKILDKAYSKIKGKSKDDSKDDNEK